MLDRWPDGTFVRHKTDGYVGQIEGITRITESFTGNTQCEWQYRIIIPGMQRPKIAPQQDLQIIEGLACRDFRDINESPLMKQYNLIKGENPGYILLFQVGCFYDIYLEDAEKASRIAGLETYESPLLRILACGVPFDSPEEVIRKLVMAGEKVALCNQVEGLPQFEGILRREVVKKYDSSDDL